MTAPALELDLVGRAVDRLTDRIGRADIPVVEAALQLGDSTPHKLPAVVVFLAGDDATDSLAPEQGALQRVTAILAVVHVIEARNTPRGAGGPAVDPLALLVGRTRGVLNGWRPEEVRGRGETLALRRGRLTAFENGRANWQDEYTVSWRAAAVQE